VCGGVQKNTTPNKANGATASLPVTAVQPMSTGMQPAMPPHTTFCALRRLSTRVYPRM
jgi:hypothetical protein